MATEGPGFFERNYFLFRRLHSLSGILPIGLFLIAHLVTNSTILWGAINARATAGLYNDKGELMLPGEQGEILARRVGTFAHEVTWINESLPFLILLEIVLWLSLAFHAGLGLYYATTGKSNTRRYGYWDNWRYSLQRWTGYIGIFFIFYHVATLRWGWTWLIPGDLEAWDYQFAASTLAATLQGGTEGTTPLGLIMSLWYFFGVTCIVFHFANGLWTAAITWGLTVTEKAMRRWAWVCAALGVVLMVAGWSSVIGFAMLDYEDARAIEEAIQKSGGIEFTETDLVDAEAAATTLPAADKTTDASSFE